MRRAIFLDKDGTLIENVPFNVAVDRIQLAASAVEALRLWREHGYELVIVTNQSGVAMGYFPSTALVDVEQRLRELLAPWEIPLAGFYYCPHHIHGVVEDYACDCECRKPKPGLLTRAAAELDLDLSRSWMVGDILNDVEAGHRAGCLAALIDNGGETEWDLTSPSRRPEVTAPDLLSAARQIVSQHNRSSYWKGDSCYVYGS